ncbi:protein O-mannosyl-transferase family [candidate division CSSED10-310 bacterium]|uniref:Protein O-mannosyl-transferase family n=1 Tax=candidate division CSSED10-310 bacterium TaxID=2855610 RepID=A0ABV6YRP4_UNCC1
MRAKSLLEYQTRMKFNTSQYAGGFVFCCSFSLYMLTMAPDVTFTDSGELAAVCTTLGIAHPTGYPLFTIIGYLWTLLPLPLPPIYKLNIFTAILTASAVTVFFKVTVVILNYLFKSSQLELQPGMSKQNKQPSRKKGQTRSHVQKEHFTSDFSAGTRARNYSITLAIISALMYGFSLTVWEQAVAVEVYSLHLLLINLILLFFLEALLQPKKQQKLLLTTAFFLGLGFANHMTTVLVLPALFYLYFKRPAEKFVIDRERLHLLLLLVIPLSVGLLLYIYLPLRSGAMPEFNWGWVSRGWDKFSYHVQGKQYHVWMFSESELWLENLIKFLRSIPAQVTWIGLVPLCYGLYRSFRQSRQLFWFLIFLILSCLTYALNYSIHDITSYFLTAFTALILFSAIGLWHIFQKIPKGLPFCFVLPLLLIGTNFAENDRSDDYLVPEYTRILVNNLQPGAIIISAQWDFWCSAFWYKQRIEGFRPDVVLIEKELLRRTWYPEQLKRWYPQVIEPCNAEIDEYLDELELFESRQKYSARKLQRKFITMLNSFINQNSTHHPIYITLDIMQSEPDIGKNYQKIAAGFTFRLEKNNKIWPASVETMSIELFSSATGNRQNYLVDGINNSAVMSLVNIGRYALFTRQAATAKKAFQMALHLNPEHQMAQEGLRYVNKKTTRP